MSINKAKISVDLNRRLGVISPNLYGATWDWRDSVRGDSVHGGMWVGDDDTIPHIDGFHQGVIAALKELSLPVILFSLGPGARTRACGNFQRCRHG